MRHVGTIHNTGSRVIVAFLQLPDAPHKCLVIQTDTLPDYYRETLNRLVQSDEAQSATEFYTILDRNKAEGVNKSLLTVFHEAGLLLALPVDNVVMNPMPGTSIPLRNVLNALGKNVPHAQGQASDQYAEPKRFNQFENNQQADLDTNRVGLANNKIRQAEILEADARRYRNEAYEMAPHLRPASTFDAPTAPAAPAVTAPAADFTPQVSTLESIASNYGSEGELDLFGAKPNA